jgi:ComF family protein
VPAHGRLDRVLRPLLDLLVPPACWSCRGPVNAGSALCPACAFDLPWIVDGGRHRSRHIGRTVTPLTLTGPARDLVHALKFRSAPAVAALMAAHVVHALPAGFFDSSATIVPVPAHPGRRRRRGYDHADLLARTIAARTGQQVAVALVRAGGRGAHQRGAGRADRLRGGGLTVTAAGPAPVRCLLVDDVRTTGATLEACAVALSRAGARRVDAVAYAQAP